jgi:hypothetical protein
VQWIACQTEIMVTALLLGAALCFGRFRGWPGFGGDWLRSVRGTVPVPAVSRARAGWAVASVILFTLALGCRENAVVFPLVMAAMEPLVWRRQVRAALVLYAVLVAVVVAYLAVRSAMLGGAALPPRPYVVSPGDPDFVRFVFDKVWYYLLGEFLLVPCIPIGGLPWFQARPLLFYGSAAGVGLGVAVIWVRHRRQPGGLIGPAWLLGFMLPALPVFASPHHLYLPGVGWAVTAMLLIRWIGGPAAARGAARWRRAGAGLVAAGTAAVFGLFTYEIGRAMRTADAVEDCVTEEIAAAPSGLKSGDRLYVANLPLLAHYARLAVEERTGLRGLRLIPLTWAPRLLGPASPTELTRIDERTIEVTVAGDRYFSGSIAQLIYEAAGRDIPDEVDRLADLGLRVQVLRRDAAGIESLRFTFDRPLSDPGLRLFWGSRVRWAYEVPP